MMAALTEEDKKLLSYVDHTLLKVDAGWDQVRALCDEAVPFGTASVCVSPCYVRLLRD